MTSGAVMRSGRFLPPEMYPDDPWAIHEIGFGRDHLHVMETIFSLANGYLGIRGTLSEGAPAHAHGTFLNGFHEDWPISHPESAYGLARTGQTIVSVPDASVIEVTVDGERLNVDVSDIERVERRLDFRTGLYGRRVRWRTKHGTTVDLAMERIVSFRRREIAAFRVTISVDRTTEVELASHLINRQDEHRSSIESADDPRRAFDLPHRVLRPGVGNLTGGRVVQGWRTTNSGLGLVVAVDHVLAGASSEPAVFRDTDDFTFRYRFTAVSGRPVQLTKTAAYRWFPSPPTSIDRIIVERTLDRALEAGFAELVSEQAVELGKLWATADVEVGGDAEVQQAIRWAIFQLHQASAALQGTSIPAKGLTGQAYDGHYFWDIDVFVLPFLVFTNPRAAEEILRFRYRILDPARQRANELSVRGALFPWRTITGVEASANFLAGTAQYHIDAAVIHGLRTYVSATGDDELLWNIGVEMAVETARMWADLGFYRHDRFHIHGVTGPDEYTALVDDNAYTNMMARMNLRYAADVVERMRLEQGPRFVTLCDRLDLDDEEIVDWRLAADAMYVPFDHQLGMTPQNESFLDLEPWDWAGTPPEMYPLLLHFHPLVIYRFQVLKQSDVVLADFLLGHERDPAVKRADFEYYDPITTGDSSLSASVQAIMAAELGLMDAAIDHFRHALFMDLSDLAGNTTDGVHMATAGGVWMALVYGFGGLRHHDAVLTFSPRLPPEWRGIRFRLSPRASRVVVTVTHQAIRFEVDGEPIEVEVEGRRHRLGPGPPTIVALGDEVKAP